VDFILYIGELKRSPFHDMVLMVKASIYLGNIKNIKNLYEGSIKVAHCKKKNPIEL
jgi:hypothetical protein